MTRLVVLVNAVLLAFFFSFPALAESEGDTLRALFDEAWGARLADEPLTATSAGVDTYNDRLPSVTAQAFARALERDQGALKRLTEINRDRLSPGDQVNYDMFQFDLESRIARAAFRPWRIPFVSDYGFYDDVTFLPDNVPLRTVKDYENYIARLADVPRYFDENIANLRKGMTESFTMARIIVEGEVSVLANQQAASAEESPLYEPFTRIPATLGDPERARLAAAGREVIASAVLPAYRKVYDFFAEEYLPNARGSLGASELPDGGAYYQAEIRAYTTLDLTPEEIHGIGRQEVARIRAEMEAVIAKIGFQGTFSDFLKFLRTDPQFYAKTPHELLAEASYLAKRIDGRMPAFFGKLPRLSYGVKAVPDSIAPSYTTGRYWGGSLKNGVAGNYMVNTFALDQRPLYELPSLTLHEGVPGHHHQIALAQEMEGVPAFRQNMYLSAFGEGWGLYSEKLGIEMGIYETPYQDFGRLSYDMWRAARLVVDTGLHALGWTREQAVQFFLENSALSEHNINTEVNRYISWPGQALSYKLGELKIWELRKKAESELGEKFDLRAFHDALLSNGSVTLGVLESVIDRYIAEQKGN